MAGRVVQSTFRPSWWMKNAHVQTILPNTLRIQREREITWEVFELSDGDCVELAWTGPESGPIALLIHGIIGNWRTPPIRGLAHSLADQGWRVCRFHFRGCGRKPNRSATAHHSAMTQDPAEVLQALAERYPDRRRVAIGISLGGNVLLKLLGDTGAIVPIDAAVAISVPFSIPACVDRVSSGFSRVYQSSLLRKLRRLVARKKHLLSNKVDLGRVLTARTFYEFDQHFTAPVHGFESADDYYIRASSGAVLGQIETPTLILHAADDPLMHAHVVPSAHELSSAVTLEVSDKGGHVGFVEGPPWRPRYWLEHRVPEWLNEVAGTVPGTAYDRQLEQNAAR